MAVSIYNVLFEEVWPERESPSSIIISLQSLVAFVVIVEERELGP